MKVIICTPTRDAPHLAFVAAIKASQPLLEAAGHSLSLKLETGNPYISGARATLLRQALDDRADVVVFIDDDVSWDPEDLLTLVEAPADVVAGTYRFKKDNEEYMGEWQQDAAGKPVGRQIGELVMLRANRVPAGFLKVTKDAVDAIMKAYPDLCYGPHHNPSVDLFQHGAYERVWWGEDYAFSRRWIAAGHDLWLLPELRLTHHGADKAYVGHLHDHLQSLPGGAQAEPEPTQSAA